MVEFGEETDHGRLSGRDDDDHIQYLNNARHAALVLGGNLHAPEAHASSHESGGSDELNLTGLTGAGFLKIPFIARWVAASGGSLTWLNRFPVARLDASNETIYMSFAVPSDLLVVPTVYLVWVGTANGTGIDIDLSSDYGAEGEAHNVHSESDTTSTYNFVANELTLTDISAILSSLALGDFVAIKVQIKQTYDDLMVIGIIFG